MKEIDQDEFEDLCSLQCTKIEICSILRVTDKTLDKWLKRTYKATFSEVFQEKRQAGFVSLRRAQFRLAQKSAAMAIFLGKQHLGQRDEKYLQLENVKKFDPDYLSYSLRQKLYSRQQEVFDDACRYIIACCSRRVGKTVLSSYALVHKIVTHYESIESGKETYFLIIAKTYEQAKSLFEQKVKEILTKTGVEFSPSMSDQRIYIGKSKKGCVIFSGSDTFDQVDKLRGLPVAFAVVDEAQSNKYCRYLIEYVIQPAMRDFVDSQLLLIGTPPRARGTTFEKIWKEENNWSKHHWTMAENIFLPGYETILEDIRREKGFSETDPLYRREYLGEFIYDQEALVYRLTDKNYYTEEDLREFVNEHINTLELLNGIDYGFSDSDAIVTFLSARDSEDVYLLKDWKANHNTTEQIVNKIKEWAKFEFIPEEIRIRLPNGFVFYADPGGGGSRTSADAMKTLSQDLTLQSRISIVNAYKVDKAYSIDRLRDLINQGKFHCPKDCEFDIEAQSTVWKRDKNDQIVQEIDDDAFHPDVADSVRYALREKMTRLEKPVERRQNEHKTRDFVQSIKQDYY